MDFPFHLISQVSIISLAGNASGGNLTAFRSLRTLRALRPLRAIPRWQGMKVREVSPRSHMAQEKISCMELQSFQSLVFFLQQVVVNSLLSAIPKIGNVSLVCLIFWLIFSVTGVHFFGGRFYKCVTANGEVLPHTTVANKTSCLAMNYTWKNSDMNFDNSLAGFLALFQVVSFGLWILTHRF